MVRRTIMSHSPTPLLSTQSVGGSLFIDAHKNNLFKPWMTETILECSQHDDKKMPSKNTKLEEPLLSVQLHSSLQAYSVSSSRQGCIQNSKQRDISIVCYYAKESYFLFVQYWHSWNPSKMAVNIISIYSLRMFVASLFLFFFAHQHKRPQNKLESGQMQSYIVDLIHNKK